jgi:hypothetical protein
MITRVVARNACLLCLGIATRLRIRTALNHPAELARLTWSALPVTHIRPTVFMDGEPARLALPPAAQPAPGAEREQRLAVRAGRVAGLAARTIGNDGWGGRR